MTGARPRALVTAERAAAARLLRALEAAGLEALALPCLRLEPVDPAPLREALARRPAWLVVTSANGARALLGALGEAGASPGPGRPLVAAVGPATAAALERGGVRVDLVPAEATAAALGRELAARGIRGARVLLALGELAGSELAEAVARAGGEPDRVTAYRTVEGLADLAAARRLLDGPPLVVTLMSGSAARALVRAVGPEPLSRHRLVCIGPSTAEEVRKLGVAVARVAREHTVPGLVEAVIEEVSARGTAPRPDRRRSTMTTGERSRALFERARAVIPGGVNSPVRAFRAVGGEPFFVESASGARLRSADGREYVDHVCSWGPLVLGHAHPAVVEAVREAATRGTSYGTPTPGEVDLAELVCRTVPTAERVRFVSSGTEATMTALRLARGATGRDLVLKFEGGYHGHADAFLVAAGSGVATLGIPGSPGVPEAVAALTATLPYNDLDAVESLMARRGSEMAAIIVEPVAGNMGVVPPEPGFLEGLRGLATKHGALLIFDEVITGFRVAPGGAQQRYGVLPDLTTLGKIIGGGLPVGAIAGPARLMDLLAPVGPVYQAGTLSGNPLAMAAGLATLETLLGDPGAFDRLEALGARLEAGLVAAGREAGAPMFVARVGSMLTPFMTAGPVRRLEDAKAADAALYGRVFHGLLDRGVYVAPSAFEAMFVSTAHDEADVDQTVRAFAEALGEAVRNG